MQIDIRLEVNNQFGAPGQAAMESMIIHEIVAEIPGVQSAVVLRNNGFAHLMPDEETRQSRQ